ncbi:MAG: DUF3572 domain-containing protein [Pseudomonadota bacterium]
MMLSLDQAEILGFEAVAWLAGDDDLFGTFLGASGADRQSFAQGNIPHEMLIAVLDFILSNDNWVRDFCDSKARKYEQPMIAREVLGGGDLQNWT